MEIRESGKGDFAEILAIVNDAARVYRGVIPADRWHEPYMSADELEGEITDGVVFWIAEQNGDIAGVMGIQDKKDVALWSTSASTRDTARGLITSGWSTRPKKLSPRFRTR